VIQPFWPSQTTGTNPFDDSPRTVSTVPLGTLAMIGAESLASDRQAAGCPLVMTVAVGTGVGVTSPGVMKLALT
jgi:hypothetical protein